MRQLIWLGCLSYLVIGLAHVIGGAVLESMMDKYDLSYQDGGQWIMNQFLGFLVGVLLAPSITARIGKRGGVLLALICLTVGEAAYSFMLPWGWMLAFAPIAGLGFGLTEAVVGAMIIELSEGKASAMSLIETFFGIGALIMPVTAAYLIREDLWQLSFPILTGLSILTLVLWATASFGKLNDKISFKGRPAAAQGAWDRKPAGYDRRVWPLLIVGAVFFLIYVGLEMSFSNYLPSMLIERTGMDDASAATVLSLFWGMVVAGRIFAGRLADKVGYGTYLLGATASAAVVFLLMASMKDVSWMLVFVGLSGLCFSGIFGIGLVYANALIPGMTERTTSLLVAFGGLGGALLPRATGWAMDRYQAGTTLWMMAFTVTGMLVILLVLLALGRKQGRQLAGHS
ncbi:MFS transporter [Paenibacillus sp. GCM10023252]|uniref:MFS transporter n=1 Tax=Paenibacillus sp. GCM10023252 TaxID=3252649 RepID=UPI00361652A5